MIVLSPPKTGTNRFPASQQQTPAARTLPGLLENEELGRFNSRSGAQGRAQPVAARQNPRQSVGLQVRPPPRKQSSVQSQLVSRVAPLFFYLFIYSEEWQWVKKLAKNQQRNCNAEMNDGDGESNENRPDYSEIANLQPSTAQLLFQSQLQRAACKLLGSMGIEGSVMQHRIYEDEVIELSPDVSVILLLPPPDSVCAVAGQSEALFHRPEFLSVPVQVFEMIHLRTYQRDLIGRYSRLSSILELDSNLAQLAMREVSLSSSR